MTCRKIQELIPLHVGDDLPSREQAVVDSHLAWCGACRDCYAEHRASRDWLRAHSAPVLDGAMLDRLRRSVGDHVRRDLQRPTAWRWAERIWVEVRRRAAQPMLTMAALILLAFGAVSVARFGQERQHPVVTATAPPPAPAPPVEHDVPDLDDHSAGLAPRPEMVSGPILAGAANAAAAETGESQDDGLRIEIQTKDPNVRIIWFTSREAVAAMEN